MTALPTLEAQPNAPRRQARPHEARRERVVRGLVGAGALLAATVAVSAAAGYARGVDSAVGAAFDVGLAAAFAAGLFVLQRAVVLFQWRGERLTISLDEGLILFGLVVLPPHLLVVAVGAGVLAAQLRGKRPALKIAFNTAVYTVAAGGAAAAFTVLVAVGAHPIAAATVGMAGYVAFCGLQVAGMFARLERAPLDVIFRERFLVPICAQALVGTSIGLALVGLWSIHPLATLAAAPFVLLASGFARLTAHVDREVEVRRRVAAVSNELVGSTQLEEVASRVVETCGGLFAAGRVTLSLQPREGKPGIAKEADFEGGPAVDRASIASEIRGIDGRKLGHIRVHPPQRTQDEYGPLDAEMLQVVAAQVAGVVENAVILGENRGLWQLQESLVEHVPAGVVYLHANGSVAYQNAHLRRALATASDAAGDALVGGLAELHEHPRLKADVARLLGDGTRFDDVRLHVRAASGQRVLLTATGVPIVDDGLYGGSRRIKGAVLLIHVATDATPTPRV